MSQFKPALVHHCLIHSWPAKTGELPSVAYHLDKIKHPVIQMKFTNSTPIAPTAEDYN